MTSILDSLKKTLEIAEKATPGPWKLDMGNWEVEAEENRFGICAVDWSCRDGCNGARNPIHPYEDGEFIAHSRTELPKLAKALIKAVELLNQSHYASHGMASHDPKQCSSCCVVSEISAILAGKGE